jgi:hypothetical protein
LVRITSETGLEGCIRDEKHCKNFSRAELELAGQTDGAKNISSKKRILKIVLSILFLQLEI